MEQVEEICRAVRKSDIVFGGMQIILSGDFLQLRPVPNITCSMSLHDIMEHSSMNRTSVFNILSLVS
jgi:hypothetical protein